VIACIGWPHTLLLSCELCHVTFPKGIGVGAKPVRICIGTQEVRDDLDGLSKDTRKRVAFRTSAI